MPTRSSHRRGSDGCLARNTPRGLVESENNIFEKAFTTDPVDVEWNDWMRWEGGLDLPILDRKDSGSTISSQENWCNGSFMADNDFRFEDAPFEIDEGARPSEALQFSPGCTTFPISFQVPEDRSYRNYSTLTQAEEQDLQNIAMPYLLSKVKISTSKSSSLAGSRSSHSPFPTPSPEPETRIRKNKKRKSILEDEDIASTLCQSRKRGHNAIEKRYRTNLNDKINCLRQGIPSICRTSSSDSKSGDEGEESDADGMDSKTGQQKYGKAAILTRALQYIKHLESTTQRLGSEVTALKTRVGAFEKLAMSGSIVITASNSARLSEPMVKTETLQSIQAGKFYVLKPFGLQTNQTSANNSQAACSQKTKLKAIKRLLTEVAGSAFS